MELGKKCILKCLKESHPPVILPHKKTITIGRGPETKITDKRCSRIQLSLTADYDKNEVKVQHNGPNISGINGLPFKKSDECDYRIINHGDTIDVLLGKYVHQIQFETLSTDRFGTRLETNPTSDTKTENGLISTVPCTSKRSTSPCSSGRETKICKSDNLMKMFIKQEKHTSVSAPVSSVSCQKNIWESVHGNKVLIFTSEGVEDRKKIAAYDLDGTLITTKSGNVFPKDINDWQIAFSEVPGKLKRLWQEEFKIVIFTNQAGIANGRVRVEDFKTKIEKIVKRLAVPIQLFACIASGGLYRKPAPGMWQLLSDKKNNGISLNENLGDHIYIGDAAGRGADKKIGPKSGKHKVRKDFSCSDRLFALNLGVKFFTPEEHFLNHSPIPFTLPSFNPAALVQKARDSPLQNLSSDKKELVVMLGGPGSGKSYASHKYLKGYVRACRDELGTRERCESLASSKLSEGYSVVIDCTHPDKASRARAVSLAKAAGVPVRCFLMTTSKEQAKHNNKFREITDPSHLKVTDMIINSYHTKYEEPTLEEGFDEIVKVDFLPKFDDPELEKLYSMYLLDK